MSQISRSRIINLAGLHMQQLRELIENDLKKANFRMQLNNLTDDIFSLKVSRSGVHTVLSIERHRHRPLEVEVIADYTQSKHQDIIRLKKKKSNNQRGGLGQYRSLWILFIFFGIIVTIISNLAGGIVKVIDKLTPGWSRGQQALGIIILVMVIPLIWIYVKPLVNRQINKRKRRIDEEIIQIVADRLILLNKELTDSKIIRCWNCFEEVQPNEEFCSQCGEKQK